MTRFLFKLSLPLTFIFIVPLLLIHAQPYDDSELRAFLMPPDGCPAPCFMGIQPGVTTVDEAIAILESHEWVERVFITSYNKVGIYRVEWRWSSSASPLLEQEHKPRSGGRLLADNGIVQYMELLTSIRSGEAWLLWGTAENYTALLQTGGPIGGPKPPKPITSIYRNIINIVWTDCPYSNQYWNAEIELIIGEPAVWLDQALTYPFVPGTTPITRYIRELTQNYCP